MYTAYFWIRLDNRLNNVLLIYYTLPAILINLWKCCFFFFRVNRPKLENCYRRKQVDDFLWSLIISHNPPFHLCVYPTVGSIVTYTHKHTDIQGVKGKGCRFDGSWALMARRLSSDKRTYAFTVKWVNIWIYLRRSWTTTAVVQRYSQ